MRRGALIILEGCDRVGKSTHSRLLVQALREEGHKAEVLQFPDRSTMIGSVINKYLEGSADLDDHAIHLLFSANRWELVPKMLKSLNSGINLIVDRYAYSGVAFSAAKKGMDLEWCKQSDVGLPKPDLVLYLELPPGANTTRSGFGDEIYENVDFQKKVKEVYSSLKDDSWQVINADQDIEDVHLEIKKHVKQVIENVSVSSCQTLWTELKT